MSIERQEECIVLERAGRAGLMRWLRTTGVLLGTFWLSAPGASANPSLRDSLPAARGGDAGAQYIVGTIYLFGRGTRQNIAEGARWLELSSRGGLVQATVALANLYDVGQGVPLDVNRADQLRQQAARAGDPTARGQIADDLGMHGQRDFRRASVLTDLSLYPEALRYAQTAAEAGSANAQLLLGHAYHFGLGVPVDKGAAFRMYERSADGGLADGSRHLAYMYEFGLGVRVDRKKALVHYDSAAAKGSSLARQAAANLRSPDYDRPRPGYSVSLPDEFKQFQCNGAGGSWDGTSCYARDTNRIINP